MKTKKNYEKPAMLVYELKQKSQLLAGSTLSAKPTFNNTFSGEETWESTEE